MLALALKFSSMLKKVIVTICDAETGEILGMNMNDKRSISDEGALKNKIRVWYESFLRGLDEQRDLSLMITVRNFKDSELLDFR